MMLPDTPTDRTRTFRTFGAGAGFGFAAGALFVALLVSQYGNVPDRPQEDPAGVDGAHGPTVPEGTDAHRTKPDPDAAGREEDAPTGTSGGVVAPPPSEAVISAPPVAELSGRNLLIPVDGIRPTELHRSFADPRNGRRHEAIDIMAPRHTQVRAVESGTIARLFTSAAGGLTIYQLDPSQRFCYYYAHLERYADGLAEGQPVQKGQVIGYVGVSGNAPDDAPHLHFAIFRLTEAKRWWEGTPIDPYEVWKGRHTG